jgi:hypothetical protein
MASVSPEKGWPSATQKDGHGRHETMAVGGHPPEGFRERPRAPFIFTECMQCVALGDSQPRQCVDDGTRVLCEEHRRAA